MFFYRQKTFEIINIFSILLSVHAMPKATIPDAWKKASEQIQAQINQSANPCDDFNAFACGGIIGKGLSMTDHLANYPLEALSQALAMLNKPEIINITGGEFYNSLGKQLPHCDEIRLNIKEQSEYSALMTLIDSSGGYPTAEIDWKPQLQSAGDIDGALRRKYTQNTFLQADLNYEYGRFVFTGAPAIPWSLEYSQTIVQNIDKLSESLQIVAEKLAQLKGTTLSTTQFQTDFANMEAMLKDLIQVSGLPSSKAWKKYPSQMKETLSFLPRKKKFPNEWIEVEGTEGQVRFGAWKSNLTAQSNNGFDWAKYFTQLQLPFSDDEIILVLNPEYFNQLATVLSKYNARVLQNYRVFLLIATYQFPLLDEDFSQNPCDPEELIPYEILSWLYVQSVENAPSYKNAMGKLLQYIESNTDARVSNLPWMDDTSKKSWLEKSAAIENVVAYSDGFEPSAIAQMIENLGSFPTYDMTTASTYTGYKSAWNRWKFPVDLALFAKLNKNAAVAPYMNTLDFNAHYANNNSPAGFIVLPLILMHATIPDLGYPAAFQFGAYGAIIGHELGHAVYSFPDSYITTASKKEMESKATCIVDQYNDFCMIDPSNSTDIKCLDGKKTESENVPDFLGIRTAYSAYKQFVKENPEAGDRLPGLEKYNMDQIYFIAAAWLFCGKDDFSDFTTSISSDDHSPGNFRVLGQTRGNPDFAKAFNCGCGTKMNPNIPYCNIWESKEEIQSNTCSFETLTTSKAPQTQFQIGFFITFLFILVVNVLP